MGLRVPSKGVWEASWDVINILPDGGGSPKGGDASLISWPIFLENYMKMKKIGVTGQFIGIVSQGVTTQKS